MRVYLAGPMSGIENQNYPEFFRVAELLRARGYEVENPAEKDGETLEDALTNMGHVGDQGDYMKLDLVRIARCDGIFLMEGSHTSEGASLERHIASYLGWNEQGVNLFSTLFMPPELRPILVGLAGYARTGKDTVAQILVDDHGFERIGFADKVRDFVAASSEGVRAVVKSQGWEAAKSDPNIRGALQRCGMAAREVIGEDVWVEAAFRDLQPGGRYVVSDVRFENEVEAIWDRGGVNFRINRPGTEPINGHVSETALDQVILDNAVWNDGSIGDLRDRVEELVDTYNLSESSIRKVYA